MSDRTITIEQFGEAFTIIGSIVEKTLELRNRADELTVEEITNESSSHVVLVAAELADAWDIELPIERNVLELAVDKLMPKIIEHIAKEYTEEHGED